MQSKTQSDPLIEKVATWLREGLKPRHIAINLNLPRSKVYDIIYKNKIGVKKHYKEKK